MRTRLLPWVLCIYAAAAMLASVPLMLLAGPAATVANGTSVRLLGAALFSLGAGAVAAARNPVRQKSLVLVEIVFTALAASVLVLKVAIHHTHAGFDERVYWILAPTLAALVLLLATFPYGKRRDAGGN